MGIVAVRASHEPFIHAVFEGHRELSAHIPVAAVTEFRLFFREQEFRNRRLVDRMAGRANYIILRMR